MHVAKIATGETEDTPEDDGKDKAAQATGRMTPERGAGIAQTAAAKRWEN